MEQSIDDKYCNICVHRKDPDPTDICTECMDLTPSGHKPIHFKPDPIETEEEEDDNDATAE